MDKNYSIKDFVEKYETQIINSDKTSFLKYQLKTEKYLPYSDKAVAAEKIVKNTSYAIVKDENGGQLTRTNRIKINSPMRYILFVMTVIDKYTNLEVNFKDVMPEFDLLNKNGLIEIIFDKIGSKEVSEFNTVVDMVLNDFMTNEYEFKNFITERLSQLNDMVQKVSPIINNVVNKIEQLSDEDADKLSKWVDRLRKTIK